MKQQSSGSSQIIGHVIEAFDKAVLMTFKYFHKDLVTILSIVTHSFLLIHLYQ